MNYTIIAPFGGNMGALFTAVREFPIERVYLIVHGDDIVKARKLEQDFKKFKIPLEIHKIEGNLWQEIFKAVAEIKSKNSGKELMINVASGGMKENCIITSAAFVNGIKAFGVDNDKVDFLPVFKFSYYTLIGERKLSILKALTDEECCNSLEELRKATKMSLSLLSYHIHGTHDAEGLKDMGLVETNETKKNVHVKLTDLGRLILGGYL